MISLTVSGSPVSGRKWRGAEVGRPSVNYLIDIENAVIVDVEATPARTYDEVAATRP
jgi:hypothetical protein